MEFLKAFIDDCKYYDIENIETKTILKNVNLKGKTILDIGAGIGRLSFLLARYAKEVVALDKDKRFKGYFIKHKKKNVKFINQSAEKFLRTNKKFDIILLAWPTFSYKLINLIKNSMHENSLFIFITCDNNSDYEKIIDKLDNQDFSKDIQNKKRFISLLPKKFKVILKEKINTKYTYPNKTIAFKVIKNSMKLWFNTKFDKEKENKLKNIISKHKQNRKIIFGEKIFFYILKK